MPDKITKVLKAIADPTRREILHVLVVAAVAMPITQISAQFNISRQGTTKHIKVLEDAGLLRIQTQGRERFCVAQPQSLEVVNRWLQAYARFWDDSLEKLGNYLDDKD